MGVVKFPFRVKVNGEYYAPNTPIKVDDATKYVRQDATGEVKSGGRGAAKPPAHHEASAQ